jgi:MFS transporter, DHA1 family, tetracycline resistance protein
MQPATHGRALAIVVAAVLVDMIGYGIIAPVMPALIVSLTGDTIASAARQAGWLTFAFAAMQFVFAPIMGSLSDRFGRRPVLLAALVAFAIDYFVMAFSPTVAWLFAGRLVAGITGASFTVGYAYITDISAPEKRTQNFGLMGMAMGVGYIIGPAIGGLVAQLGPRAPFFLAGGLALINAVLGWFLLQESLPADRRRPFKLRHSNPVGMVMRLRRNPTVLRLAAAVFLIQLGHSVMPAIWAFFTILKFGWTEALVGLSLAFSGLLAAIVRGGLIRILIPRWGEARVISVAVSTHIVALMIFAFGGQSWMMFAAILIDALAGLALPALSGLASHEVAQNEQGELQGAIASLTSLSTIIAPVAASQLFALFSRPDAAVYFPGAPFIFAAVLWIAGYAMFRERKQAKAVDAVM